MFRSGRPSRPPRRRNNCCRLTRGGSLHSCLPCIRILPPASGVFRLKKKGPRTSASTSPHALRHRVIKAAHQFLGHAGITATAHFCWKRVYMFRLVPEVHRGLQQCHACQIKSQRSPNQKDVHRPSVQAGAPFQVWSMDVLWPLRASSEGHRHLLTLKDVFSKWFEAVPLSNTTSEKVLQALQTLYARFGYPFAGPHQQRHILPVSDDARGFPTGQCPPHLHPDIQPSVQLCGKDSPRPQHNVVCSAPSTRGQLGGSVASSSPRPPQRRS